MERKNMKEVYESLRENIRLLSAKYDLYPVEVATLMGMSKRTYAARRKAPWTFSLSELEKLAEILHTDVDTLLYGDVMPVSKRRKEKEPA